MAPYSMDLRKRVLRDADAGLSSHQLAGRYSVSRAWVDRLKQRRRETGEVAPRQQTTFRRRTLTDQQKHRLVALITAQPDATLAELRAALPTTAAISTCGGRSSGSALPSEKTVRADEQRRPDVVAARRQWVRWQPLRDVRQYVFLDECGVTTDLLRRYGRSPRGTRLDDRTRCSHWHTHTHPRGVAPRRPHGAGGLRRPDRSRQCSRVRRAGVGAHVAAGRRRLLDNLAVHKYPAVQATITQAGATIRFLPPYSPDFNPIEQVFAKLKAIFRAARPRSFDHVVWRRRALACRYLRNLEALASTFSLQSTTSPRWWNVRIH